MESFIKHLQSEGYLDTLAGEDKVIVVLFEPESNLPSMSLAIYGRTPYCFAEALAFIAERTTPRDWWALLCDFQFHQFGIPPGVSGVLGRFGQVPCQVLHTGKGSTIEPALFGTSYHALALGKALKDKGVCESFFREPLPTGKEALKMLFGLPNT